VTIEKQQHLSPPPPGLGAQEAGAGAPPLWKIIWSFLRYRRWPE